MKKRIGINIILFYLLMFVLVIIGEGLKLRSYSLYLICGLFLLSSAILLKNKNWQLFYCKELVFLLLFLMFSGMSAAWAMRTQLVIYRLKILCFLVVLLVVMTNNFYWKSTYQEFIPAYFLMGLLLSLLCIVYFGPAGVVRLIIGGIRLGEDDALFMGINANTIAIDCAIAGIIGAYYGLFYGNKRAYLALIPTFLVVVATGSRKGIVMFLMGILMLIYFYQRERYRGAFVPVLKICLVVLGCFLVIRAVLELPGLEKLKDQYMGLVNYVLGNKEQADISTRVRDRMVTIGLEQFQKTPILGIGLDNGKVINLLYNNFPAYLHNNYIELLVDVGLIGTGLYYSPLLLLLLKHLKRLREHKPIVYISLVLLAIRLVSDWGRVSYFDYMNIPMTAFWIAIAYGFDRRQDALGAEA